MSLSAGEANDPIIAIVVAAMTNALLLWPVFSSPVACLWRLYSSCPGCCPNWYSEAEVVLISRENFMFLRQRCTKSPRGVFTPATLLIHFVAFFVTLALPVRSSGLASGEYAASNSFRIKAIRVQPRPKLSVLERIFGMGSQ